MGRSCMHQAPKRPGAVESQSFHPAPARPPGSAEQIVEGNFLDCAKVTRTFCGDRVIAIASRYIGGPAASARSEC
jgi:hypothetical protein